MEKLKKTMGKINYGAVLLAMLVFCESTAFGFNSVVALVEGKITLDKNKTEDFSVGILPVFSHENENDEMITEVVYDGEVEKEKALISPAPTGGPDQPEVQSFTPIGTSDMVDPFTGDFSYNIPLLDVDGYPVNIAYNAGVTMDQEASWVGLGWNLNPGVVNRVMRGLPDDFNGKDEVVKEMNIKDNVTIGGSVGVDFELAGIDPNVPSTGFNLGLTLGVQHNNYTGFSGTFSVSPSLAINKAINGNGNRTDIGLGFSGSSSEGSSLSPSANFSKSASSTNDKQETTTITKGINLGSSFNSRAGLSNFTVGYTRTTEKSHKYNKNYETYRKGVSTGPLATKSTQLPISSSFNLMQSTYTPQISMPMKNSGGTFNLKLGPDAFFADLHGRFSGFYYNQRLAENTIVRPGYGYMNLELGQDNKNAMLDFNRENDGPFSKNTPALPIPNLTYDIFSVSGQGVAGSYRPSRMDIGHVFDPEMTNSSSNGSFGFEVGLGGTYKGGIDVSLTVANSKSGDWNNYTNGARNQFKFKSNNLYFREANEMAVNPDSDHFNRIGGDKAVQLFISSYNSALNLLFSDEAMPPISLPTYDRQIQERQNQVMYQLTNDELKAGMGIEELHPNAYPKNVDTYDHHIGQFTVLNTEGSRYVYGLPAYSYTQRNVSFAVGATKKDSANSANCNNGLVDYTAGVDNSINNERGVDNYFSAQTTPAFAHSYMLTTVLNVDYVDADNIPGPSKGDLGGYLSIDYKKIDNYKWRNPVAENKASYDEGFQTDNGDDKGHYLYGEKELWYVDTLKSKNHIAIFHTSDREDAVSVKGQNGGLDDALNAPRMQRLDSIQLFAIPEFEQNDTTAIPLKTVHFRYDYSLCTGYEGHITGEGKLTLKKVFFTYQGSNKGRYTPYTFEYGQRFENGTVADTINPSFNSKAIDRWNSYKEQPYCSGDILTDPLRPSDFPYVGFDKEEVDNNVTAWNLSTIKLPSGGRIQVDYESDDYAVVQNKAAHNMFKIIGVEDDSGSILSSVDGLAAEISKPNFENAALYIELLPDLNSPSGYDENWKNYVSKDERIYFRALMEFMNKYDYVPGYARVSDKESDFQIVTIGNKRALRILLQPDKLRDVGSAKYNPISVAAVQFARLHLSKFIPPSNISDLDSSANLSSFANGLLGALTSYGELLRGPNKPLWNNVSNNVSVGRNIVLDKSWVRLRNPQGKKLGGGHRVKQIRIYDAWDEMTGQEMDGFFYGQEYSYEINGISSGVAAYEPQPGNDENPFRQPIAADEKRLLAPDIRNYQETPFGEQFFPSASVGYRRVEVKNIEHQGVKRTATGKVVHEFYTAREYPTIAKRTTPKYQRFRMPVIAVFFSLMIDEMTASQGFVVENNNMHGKPKRQSVYAEGQNEPITMVEHHYLDEPLGAARHLVNDVTTITKEGTTEVNTLGLNYEAVADFRRSTSNTISGSAQINLNYTAPVFILPSLYGSGSYERTAFRSATITKVIERFGIESRTVAKDLGSEVETKNLAYDAETGTVLLTQTKTNFEDDIYSFTYPAHWYYNEMGQAYKNINVDITNSLIGSSLLTFSNGNLGGNLSQQFVKGDEVAVWSSPSALPQLAWVVEKSSSGIRVLLKDGTPLSGLYHRIKVLRSGRRNIQTTPMGSLVLRENPLNNLQGNIFEHVLQAGATEFNDEWRTFCECFLDEESTNYTTNPYVLGTKGTWRPVTSYLHLSGRNQTFENNNSNIRDDGFFTSFTPFYKLNNGNWSIDRQNWTFTSEVVEFSPFGQALETRDALNRFSSSMYGYNQTLPLAVAANTRYRQLGFDGFEDYDYDNCSGDHFRIGNLQNAEIIDYDAHTGRNALRVSSDSSVVFVKKIGNDCLEECIESGYFPLSKGNSYTLNVTELENNDFIFLEYVIVSGNPFINEYIDNTTGDKMIQFQLCTDLSSNCHDFIEILIRNTEGCLGVGILEVNNNDNNNNQ